MSKVAAWRPDVDVGPCRFSAATIIITMIALAGCAKPPLIRGPESAADPVARAGEAKDLLVFPEPGGDRPLLAIVIDDVGQSMKQVEPFLDIPLPISFSVLSAAAMPRRVALSLETQGRDVLAHVPMEPIAADHMSGPGFLLTSMTTREILKILAWDLDRVPGAKGVNNHMGSRFTKDPYAMAVILEELKRRGMYFLDSRTDPGTRAREVAERTRTPFLERDVFLDDDPAPSEISVMMKRAIALAHERGCAIAIGHPKKDTADAISRFALDPDRDVDVVPVSRLVGHPCRSAAP